MQWNDLLSISFLQRYHLLVPMLCNTSPSLGSTQLGCTLSPGARLNILETKKTRVYCRVLQHWNVCALTEACQRVIVGLYTSDPRILQFNLNHSYLFLEFGILSDLEFV